MGLQAGCDTPRSGDKGTRHSLPRPSRHAELRHCSSGAAESSCSQYALQPRHFGFWFCPKAANLFLFVCLKKGQFFSGQASSGRQGSQRRLPASLAPGAGKELLSRRSSLDSGAARLVTCHPVAERGPGAHREVTDPAALTQLHITVTASGTGQIALLLSSDSCRTRS